MTSRRVRPRLQERLDAARLEEVFDAELTARCEWPECKADAEFPAPRSRSRLRDYAWFCLEHVREWNRCWDYFGGMSEEEIEAHRRADVTWHRPSWPFGSGPTREDWNDPFDFLGDTASQSRTAEPPMAPAPDRATTEAMGVLGLEPGFSAAELKKRYKALAKAHHPDLNGGDEHAGARLRRIIEAYEILLEADIATG